MSVILKNIKLKSTLNTLVSGKNKIRNMAIVNAGIENKSKIANAPPICNSNCRNNNVTNPVIISKQPVLIN